MMFKRKFRNKLYALVMFVVFVTNIATPVMAETTNKRVDITKATNASELNKYDTYTASGSTDGGAIRVKPGGSIVGDYLTPNFIGNQVRSNSDRDATTRYGGAIYIYGSGKITVGIKDSSFNDNRIWLTAKKKASARGGAIHNEQSGLLIEDSSFTNNYLWAYGNSSSIALGGAINTTANLTIAAKNKNVEFEGNYTKTNQGYGEGSAIYVESSNATLTLDAASGKSITFADANTSEGDYRAGQTIEGKSGYKINITGAGSVKFKQSAATPTYKASGIYGAAVTVGTGTDTPTLDLGYQTVINNATSITINSGATLCVDTAANVTLSGDAKIQNYGTYEIKNVLDATSAARINNTNGTVKLNGAGLGGAWITAGTLEFARDIIVDNASYIVTDTNIVDSSIKLTLTSGTLSKEITNNGTVALNGVSSINAAIKGGTLNVNENVTATDASYIAADENTVADGKTLTLGGGILSKTISGSGQVTIDGSVSSYADYFGSGLSALVVNVGKTLTLLFGTLSKQITGNGNVVIDAFSTVNSDADKFANTNSGSLYLAQQTIPVLGTVRATLNLTGETLTKTITGYGNVNINGNVTSAAANFVSDLNTLQVLNGKTLTLTGTGDAGVLSHAIASGGSGAKTIIGDGTTDASITATGNGITIATDIEIKDGSSLTALATNVSGVSSITNAGTLVLNGGTGSIGTLTDDDTPSGTTNIGNTTAATVTVTGNVKQQGITVGSGSKLNISGEEVKVETNGLANEGELNFDKSGTTTVYGNVTGNGTTKIAKGTTVIIDSYDRDATHKGYTIKQNAVENKGTLRSNAESGSTIGTLTNIGGTLDLRIASDAPDQSYWQSTFTVGTFGGQTADGVNSKVSFDVDMTNIGSGNPLTSDYITVIETGVSVSGTIDLGKIRITSGSSASAGTSGTIQLFRPGSGATIASDFKITDTSITYGATTYKLTQAAGSGDITVTVGNTYTLPQIINLVDLDATQATEAAGVTQYTLTGDETATGNLGTLTRDPSNQGTPRNLTIAGQDNEFDGGTHTGITVANAGDTLRLLELKSFYNFGSGGTGDAVTNNVGTLIVEDSTIGKAAGTTSDITNRSTLNFIGTSTVYGNIKDAAEASGTTNIDKDANVTLTGTVNQMKIANEGTLKISGTSVSTSAGDGNGLTNSGILQFTGGTDGNEVTTEVTGDIKGTGTTEIDQYNNVTLKGNVTQDSIINKGDLTLDYGDDATATTTNINTLDGDTGTTTIGKKATVTITGDVTQKSIDNKGILEISGSSVSTTEGLKNTGGSGGGNSLKFTGASTTVTGDIIGDGWVCLTIGNGTDAAAVIANGEIRSINYNENGFTIAKDSSLTINADNLKTSVTNGDATAQLFLKGGTLGSSRIKKDFEGSVSIIEDVTAYTDSFKHDGALTVNSGKTLNLIGSLEGADSPLSHKITGAGNVAIIEKNLWSTVDLFDNDGTLSVRSGATLTLTGGTLTKTITNNGTVTLYGAGLGDACVTSGTLRFAKSITVADAGYIAADTNFVRDTVTLTLAGGTLAKAISGQGTTKINENSAVIANAAINTAITVADSASLTAAATYIGGAVANSGTVILTDGNLAKAISENGSVTINGVVRSSANNFAGTLASLSVADTKTLVLTGGTLSKEISGTAGTTEINGDVTANAKIGTAAINITGGTLSIVADNIGGVVTNDGTLELNGGKLDQLVSASVANANGCGTIDLKQATEIAAQINNQDIMLSGNSDDYSTVANPDYISNRNNQLTFNGGGFDFTDGKTTSYTFDAINLTGDGHLKLDVDLANEKMDTISSSSAATVTGSAVLHITALTLLSDSAKDTTEILFTDDANLKAATVYDKDGESLHVASHAQNYIAKYDKETGKFTFTMTGVSATTKAISDSSVAMNLAFLQIVNNMQKRLGDLRGGEKSDMAWARFQRSNDDFGSTNLSGNLYQVGYDFALKNDTKSRGYFGLSLERFDGSQSFANGNGDAKSTSLGAYYTKIYDSGHYFDFIFRYGRLESDTHNFDAIAGIATNLDYAMNVVMLSGEYGYRANLGKSGLYLEPQAEVIYGYLSSANATSNTGIDADIDSTNHFVTRLGLAFGQRVKNFNYYLRGSYYHDFAGTTNITYGGTPYKQDGAQNWWEISLGGGWYLSKVSYFYAEFTKHFKDISNSLNFNVGFRFTL